MLKAPVASVIGASGGVALLRGCQMVARRIR